MKHTAGRERSIPAQNKQIREMKNNDEKK